MYWNAEDTFDVFVCDRELLMFVGAKMDEFTALSTRLRLLTLCTEHPHVCGSYLIDR